MEIKKDAQNENQERTIQLVDGEFTPTQAAVVIAALIEQKIKYHKLEGLQNWERDHKYDQVPLRNRITELEEEMKRTKDFISNLKDNGNRVKIDGVITMTVV